MKIFVILDKTINLNNFFFQKEQAEKYLIKFKKQKNLSEILEKDYYEHFNDFSENKTINSFIVHYNY